MMNWAKVLAFLATEIPDFETIGAEIENEFHTIAHGEGGLGKIAKAASGAAQIAQAASKVAAKVGAAI